jgi:hypothetical protein
LVISHLDVGTRSNWGRPRVRSSATEPGMC